MPSYGPYYNLSNNAAAQFGPPLSGPAMSGPLFFLVRQCQVLHFQAAHFNMQLSVQRQQYITHSAQKQLSSKPMHISMYM